MKKTAKYLIIAIVGISMFTSCQQLLTENPPTAFTDTVVFRDEAGCESALVGCYANMRNSGLWQGNMFEWLGYASGILHWKQNRTGVSDFTLMFEQAFPPTYAQSTQLDQLYRAIGSCNVAIQMTTTHRQVSEEFGKEIAGEACLLRAIMYFTLIRMFGDLPLVTVPPSTYDDVDKKRTPSNIIYKQIIDDLNTAWEWMRSPERQMEVTGLNGRPNKWAAKAFLAKVYVQIGSIMSYPDDQPESFTDLDFTDCGITTADQAWTLALETAEDVINNGPYELCDDYSRLFRWTDPEDFQLKERIFVLQVTENGAYAGQITAYRSLPNYIYGSAQGADVATNNGNFGRVRPSRYFFQKWAGAHGGEKAGPGRADGFDDIYVSCPDPRFDASMFHTSYRYYNGGNKDKISTMNMYPKDKLVANIGSTSDAMAITGLPFMKKYLDPKYNGNYGYADFYLLRFADMYLMAAEAAAELSNGPGDAMWNKAFQHMETIHRRARNSAPEGTTTEHPKWTSSQFASKQDLVDALMYERFYELMGEGHEWFDIRRKGTKFMIRNLNKPLNEFNRLPTEGANPLGVAADTGAFQIFYLGRTYSEDEEKVRTRLLCALRNTFIASNPELDPIRDQNPGW